jgi:hypothetical protein
MQFDLLPLRLEFRACDAIRFPTGKAANVLRGAFGLALDQAAFAPRLAGGPSGLADPPRPYVFRCRHLDGATVPAGATFHFHVHLFQPSSRDLVTRAFAEAAPRGAELIEASGDKVAIDLAPRPDAPPHLRVEFLTPTELKQDGRLVARPDFPVLIARIRDRVSTLRALYGPGPLDIDFAALSTRAAAVRMTRCELAPVSLERHSSRTGQTHPIGGWVGSAEYEGDLGEFLPYLEAARWTGVGRQAVWGKGEIAIVDNSRSGGS